MRSRRSSRKYLSSDDLALGQQLLSEFNGGASFENIARAHTLTKTRTRMLMLEAGRNATRSAQPQAPAQSQIDARVANVAADATNRVLSELFDSEALRELVQDEVKKFPPQTGEIKIKTAEGKVVGSIKHSHTMLKETLRTLDAGFENVLLVGPAGSGKTTLASQLAKCLGRKFGFLSLSGGTTEGKLIGRITSTGKYISARFVEMYEKGGVFLLDEVDAADPNVLLVLNSALANGALAVPDRVDNPVAERHPNFVLICAANTWGTGADWQYVGRNQLDAAFLSRFAGAVLEVGYDEVLERSLTAEPWYVVFVQVRSAAQLNRLRRVLGTREMLAGQKLLQAGYTDRETWQRLTAGWTPDERSKARIPA